jgi:hypothetical protein
MFGLGGGLVALMVAVFVAILAILWIMLPFAVFGIRKRVDASTALQEQLLHELKWPITSRSWRTGCGRRRAQTV